MRLGCFCFRVWNIVVKCCIGKDFNGCDNWRFFLIMVNIMVVFYEENVLTLICVL